MSRLDMIRPGPTTSNTGSASPNHPWTNGQVERTGRTIKEATTKRHHYEGHAPLRAHLDPRRRLSDRWRSDGSILDATNRARRLTTLKGLTPVQFIWTEWQARSNLLYEEPCHLMTGLSGSWRRRSARPRRRRPRPLS